MITKGQKVTLTRDLYHHRYIFGNAMVEQPEVSLWLKAGTLLEVVNGGDGPDADAECVTENGAYYIIPVEQLAPAEQEA